jgi:hypothetical protein
MHQKLTDLHSEVLKYPDLILSDYYLFPNPRNISREESFQATRKPH